MFERETAVRDQVRPYLREPYGKWGLFHQGGLVGIYETGEAADDQGAERFGYGKFAVLPFYVLGCGPRSPDHASSVSAADDWKFSRPGPGHG